MIFIDQKLCIVKSTAKFLFAYNCNQYIIIFILVYLITLLYIMKSRPPQVEVVINARDV